MLTVLDAEREMENPRFVNRGLVGLVGVVGAASVAYSLYLGDVHPLVVGLLITAGVALGFVIVTGIFAVTVWPLVLLIAMMFDGLGRRSVAARSAEPAASADRGWTDPGHR